MIDLSKLPPPLIIDLLSFTDARTAWLADFQQRNPQFSAPLESDPAYKIMETGAYRETVLRQAIIDAGKSVLLPFASGATLENLASLFGVTRLVVQAANNAVFPPVPAIMETDADLRARVLLSLDGYSAAGPVGAYQFWALSAAGSIKSVSVVGPPTVQPGHVVITVQSSTHVNPASGKVDGTASQAEIDAVKAKVSADTVRPLTDYVTVQSVTPVDFDIVAAIYTPTGPDAATILAAAQSSLASLIESRNKVGLPIYISSIYRALSVPGVTNVTMTRPLADIAITYEQVGHYTGTIAADITFGGVEN